MDVTTGLPVIATVELLPGCTEIRIDGGRGVGRVTKPGLDQPVGAAAINHVPRQMIAEALRREAEAACYTGGFAVTISIQNGEEVARRTFNPHIGVEGRSFAQRTIPFYVPFFCEKRLTVAFSYLPGE